MDIVIEHTTTYTYESPINYAIQTLRKAPRNFEGQFVRNWWVETNPPRKVLREVDGFGNFVHTVSIAKPIEKLTVQVSGQVDTTDTAGVIRGTFEPFPPELFLSTTHLTEASADIRAFAHEVNATYKDRLDCLHALMKGISSRMAFLTDKTDTMTSAAEAFEQESGVCQDFAHIFIACARHLGIPARYVGGYFLRADGQVDQEAGHAWAEALIDKLGWVGFDPAHCFCTTEQHIRVATALDYLGAAPVRGVQKGGSGENMEVSVTVKTA